MSARMASSNTTFRNSCACAGFMFEMNIFVAARHACGDQLSGLVKARMRAHVGKEGIILNILGSGPDL